MRTRNLIVAGLLVVALGLMARALIENVQNFDDLDRSDVFRVVGALALTILSTLLLATNWLLILVFLSAPVRVASTLRFFLTTWPFRYIPGTLPYHAARVMMAERFGATKGSVAASIAYESVLMISSAALIGVVGLLIAVGTERSAGWLYVLAGLPLLLLPVLLHPRLLIPLANRLLAVTKRSTLTSADVLTMRQTGFLFLAYASVHCLTGLAFWLVAPTITGSSLNPMLAVGAFSMASAIGVAVIFVPGGIGVREGAIVVLLNGALSSNDAFLLGGSVRAISIVADLIPLTLLAVLSLGERLWRIAAGRRSIPDPAPPVSRSAAE